MEETNRSTQIVRFGSFEVDLRAAELRRSGLRVRLQEQPFRILELLLERPGETVTREELRQRLWPADVFVAVDQSLNNAIKKLRAALHDPAENPRFIQTVARHGYRFIAPVEVVRVAPLLQFRPAGRGHLPGLRSCVFPGSLSLRISRSTAPASGRRRIASPSQSCRSTI